MRSRGNFDRLGVLRHDGGAWRDGIALPMVTESRGGRHPAPGRPGGRLRRLAAQRPADQAFDPLA